MDPEQTQPCPDHWEKEVAPSPEWELSTVNSPPSFSWQDGLAGHTAALVLHRVSTCLSSRMFPMIPSQTGAHPEIPCSPGQARSEPSPQRFYRNPQQCPSGSPVHPSGMPALPCPSQLVLPLSCPRTSPQHREGYDDVPGTQTKPVGPEAFVECKEALTLPCLAGETSG